MTIRFSGEQFSPDEFRGRVEWGGAHSREFTAASMAVLMDRIMEVYHREMGREATPEPEPVVAAAPPRRAAPAPAPKPPASADESATERTVPRRNVRP